MKNWIVKISLLALVALGLSGCIEERVIVKVKKDGSGIVEHYSYNNVDDAMGGFLSGMMEQEGMEDAKAQVDTKLKGEYDDEYFQNFAKEMGEGVTVKDYELGSNGAGMKGYHATYAFKDINAIDVKMREDMASNDDAELSDQKDVFTKQPNFSMSDGVLKIKVPHDFEQMEEGQAGASDMDNMPPQMLGMMAAMFQGMRISVSIEGLDPIKETNAHHRDGNTVLITDIQMDKLLGNPEALGKLQKVGNLPREEMQAMADATDGMDVDLQEEIVIRF